MELQLRPFVVFEPAEGKDFCVRNIGHNTALNVQIVPFVLFPSALAAFPQSVPFLRKDEARPLPGRRTVSVEGEVIADECFDRLRPLSERGKEETEHFRPMITIEFENVTGQRYFVQESLLYGDLAIIDSGPVPPPASRTVRQAWPRLPPVWQQLNLSWRKLQSAWPQLKGRKKREGLAPTRDEQEWVDRG
jgi:hypothetical protein